MPSQYAVRFTPTKMTVIVFAAQNHCMERAPRWSIFATNQNLYVQKERNIAWKAAKSDLRAWLPNLSLHTRRYLQGAHKDRDGKRTKPGPPRRCIDSMKFDEN